MCEGSCESSITANNFICLISVTLADSAAPVKEKSNCLSSADSNRFSSTTDSKDVTESNVVGNEFVNTSPETLRSARTSGDAAKDSDRPPIPNRLPSPISTTDSFSEMRSPTKEKSICLSSGLKLIDSATPENFLSRPDPAYAGTKLIFADPVTLIVPEDTQEGCQSNVWKSERAPLRILIVFSIPT